MNDQIEAIRRHHEEADHTVQPCKVTFVTDGSESDCDVQTLLDRIDELEAVPPVVVNNLVMGSAAP